MTKTARYAQQITTTPISPEFHNHINDELAKINLHPGYADNMLRTLHPLIFSLFLCISMTEQLWGVVQKLAYWVLASQRHPGCVIRWLFAHIRVTLCSSMTGLTLFNVRIRNQRACRKGQFLPEPGIEPGILGPKPSTLSTRLSLQPSDLMTMVH